MSTARPIKPRSLNYLDASYLDLVGNAEPHFLQSPSTLNPTRDALPQLEQTIATFETCSGDSCSAMPPLVFLPDFELTVFLTTRTCSTSTRLLSGNTRSTRPRLPASEPESTSTVSLR